MLNWVHVKLTGRMWFGQDGQATRIEIGWINDNSLHMNELYVMLSYGSFPYHNY